MHSSSKCYENSPVIWQRPFTANVNTSVNTKVTQKTSSTVTLKLLCMHALCAALNHQPCLLVYSSLHTTDKKTTAYHPARYYLGACAESRQWHFALRMLKVVYRGGVMNDRLCLGVGIFLLLLPFVMAHSRIFREAAPSNCSCARMARQQYQTGERLAGVRIVYCCVSAWV